MIGRVARDLDVDKGEIVRALVALPAVVVIGAGLWFACAFFLAVAS